jgi:hypothetical protein
MDLALTWAFGMRGLKVTAPGNPSQPQATDVGACAYEEIGPALMVALHGEGLLCVGIHRAPSLERKGASESVADADAIRP